MVRGLLEEDPEVRMSCRRRRQHNRVLLPVLALTIDHRVTVFPRQTQRQRHRVVHVRALAKTAYDRIGAMGRAPREH